MARAKQANDMVDILEGTLGPICRKRLLNGRGVDRKRLVTHYLLFVISLTDRVVDLVGITTRPDEAWMLQVGRNLIDSESGATRGKGYLILDRDTKYTDQFRRLIRGSGTNVIRLPPRSPNLNA